MADGETLLITGSVSTTVQPDYKPADLAPNNYLTLVWVNKEGVRYDSLDIDDKKALQFTNDLNSAIEQGINSGKLAYVGSTKYVNVESIAKYLAQNIIDSSPQRTVVNALIGVLSGNTKEISESTINLAVNLFGEVAEKAARSIGFSDPHEIFASFASENTLKIVGELGNKAYDFMKSCTGKFKKNKEASETNSKTNETTGKKYVGLIMGLTTSDTESYDITIPRKKVEDGSDYTTHLLPQPFKKDFNVILTNKVLSSDFSRTVEIENIEKVKDKLIEITQSRIPFDIYIRLSSDKCYKRSNVYFSSISFTKDENSGDGYTCSFSVEPITTFNTKTFISNRKYFPTASKTSSNGLGYSGYGSGFSGSGKSGSMSGHGGAPSGTYNDFNTNGDPLKIGWVSQNGRLKDFNVKDLNALKTLADKNQCDILYYPGTLHGINFRLENYNNTAVAVIQTYKNGKKVAAGSIKVLKEDCIKGDGSFDYPNKNFYYLKPGVQWSGNFITRPNKPWYRVVDKRSIH